MPIGHQTMGLTSCPWTTIIVYNLLFDRQRLSLAINKMWESMGQNYKCLCHGDIRNIILVLSVTNYCSPLRYTLSPLLGNAWGPQKSIQLYGNSFL